MTDPRPAPDVAYLRIGTKNTTRLWHPKPHPTMPWYSVPYYSQRTLDELVEALELAEIMMRMRGLIEMADQCAALIAKHRKGGA